MRQKAMDTSQLSPIQRIILTSNGTVTKLLEDLLGEQLTVIKLHESMQTHEAAIPYLELPAQQQVIQRKICLQGKDSGINWLYAESMIVPERLEPSFRDELLESQIPIGNLWSKYRVETFKEILPPFQQPAGELASHLAMQAQQLLLGRTYRVFSRQQPVMMLTEMFPAHYFIEFRK
jgi:chorismate-pyruvate lyase